MDKEIITEAELLAKIRELTTSFPECQNLSVDSVTHYLNRENLANWAVNWVRLSGPDNDHIACMEKIKPGLIALMERYDIGEK